MDQHHPHLTTEPVIVSSTWPWRGSEKRTIAAVALLGVGLGAWLQGWWWLAAAVGIGAACWLYRIGHDRKARSLVTATVAPDRIALRSVTAMGDSAVALDAVDEIDYREFRSDRVLLLVGGGTAARVPARLLDHEPVRDALRRVLARGPRVTPRARTLLDEAGLP